MEMSHTDRLQRFLFEEAPVRGALVSLHDSWRQVLSRKTYPQPVRDLLGEMMAAAVLLGASLKFEGTLVLQMHGTGALRLAVVECDNERCVRATAKWEGNPVAQPVPQLLGAGGRFVMTLDPKVDNGQTWQGVVALEGNSVGEMLENYMRRSEQLDTRLILAADGTRAGGLMLQRMPDGQGDEDGWPRALSLAQTLKADELLQLEPLEILRRLFHEESIRAFEAEPVTFACTCSRERVGGMLKMLGAQEAGSILMEQGSIEIGCEFCNQRYVFDEDEVNELYQLDVVAAAREARH
jgi:molecular chaperone Hsp33